MAISSTVPPIGSTVILPENLAVDIEITQQISSHTATIDEYFPIKLAQAIIINGQIVVPVGTPGVGQVVHAARAGGGGRAGELILAARYLELNGVHILLRRFRYGATGQTNGDEAFMAGIMVPFGQLFVKGKETIIYSGFRANAVIAADTEIKTTP